MFLYIFVVPVLLTTDTSTWSAEEMYADGYHQLASLKGISASGASIMPQRLEDWFDRYYYVDILSFQRHMMCDKAVHLI